MERIEQIILTINQSLAQKCKLTDVQRQYLAILSQEQTIEKTILFFYRQGWLISFTQMYDLVLQLNQAGALTPNLDISQSLLNQNGQIFKTSNSQQQMIDTQGKIIQNHSQVTALNLKYETFSSWPFYRSIPENIRQYLWGLHSIEHIKPGQYVIKHQENTRDLWTQISGSSVILMHTRLGLRMAGHISPPATFGELGFFLAEPRTADIKTEVQSSFLKIPMTNELSNIIKSDLFKQLSFRFFVLRAFLYSEIFKNIPEYSMDELIFKGRLLNVQKSQTLFNQGDVGSTCYVLVEGQLGVFQNGSLINRLHQGTCFGEIALFCTMGQRTAQITAQTDCLVLEIHQKDFYNLLSRNIYLATLLESIAYERKDQDITRQKRQA